MTTFDHKDNHVWGVDGHGRVRCAFMFCDARPTEAERQRAVQEVEDRASIELDWRSAPRR